MISLLKLLCNILHHWHDWWNLFVAVLQFNCDQLWVALVLSQFPLSLHWWLPHDRHYSVHHPNGQTHTLCLLQRVLKMWQKVRKKTEFLGGMAKAISEDVEKDNRRDFELQNEAALLAWVRTTALCSCINHFHLFQQVTVRGKRICINWVTCFQTQQMDER